MKWDDDRPRPQHYEFAHRALPAIAGRVMRDLPAVRHDLDAMLRFMWGKAGERVADAPAGSVEGLHGEVVEVAGREVVLVTLPPAEHATEAHFVAIVPGDPPRVFTLEHTWHVPDDAPGTVLGEWTEERHVNYGDGPEPEADAFLTAVAARL